MHKWMIITLAMLAGLGLSVEAFAQDDDRSDMRAKEITDDEFGVTIVRPEGWVAGEKPKGALVIFRAAGDEQSQLEVRATPNVKRDQRQIFFTSIHSKLQKTGFVKEEVREEVTYGGKKGVETEYVAPSKNNEKSLVVWQYHRGDAAWMVFGFFPAEARDKYYADFQKLIETMTFDED